MAADTVADAGEIVVRFVRLAGGECCEIGCHAELML
jgi:hypothetical protein